MYHDKQMNKKPWTRHVHIQVHVAGAIVKNTSGVYI